MFSYIYGKVYNGETIEKKERYTMGKAKTILSSGKSYEKTSPPY